ncbi:MAG: hypothetical protein Q9184_005440 [Pyrenodesmia sp. 2 TL-2023]
MKSPPASSPSHSSIRQRALAALARCWAVVKSSKPPASQEPNPKLPPISESRLLSSLHEKTPTGSLPDIEVLKDASKKDETYLYLAYGSNLAASTFRGVRGIRPLAALNVVVPELVMTFDLAGFPYTEPCFANTAYRSTPSISTSPQSSDSNSAAQAPTTASSEKTPLLLPSYENPHWDKGLVGVVYEVTASDYAQIIATEGGGAGYQDVLTTCHPLPAATTTVPSNPTTPPFKAHTLYCPLLPPGSAPPKDGGAHYHRPDPGYAQPSQRYIDLIRTGAEEHDIPQEYRDYLDSLKPYTITTQGQRMGRFVFSMTWLRIIRAVFMLNRVFRDEHGRSPPWLVRLLGSMFVGVWASYDWWMKGLFGDGERTIEDAGGEGQGRPRRKLVKRRREGIVESSEKDGLLGGAEHVA